MRKNKTCIIAVILALLVAFNIQITTFAADSDMIVNVESVSGEPSDTVELNLTLQNNPGISSIKFNVEYDDYLTLTDVEFNSAFGSYVTTPEPYRNPQPLSMLSPMSDISINGTFATLTFKISESAPSNYSANVSITYDEDDIFNSSFDNVDVAVENGCVFIGGNDTSSFTIQAEQVSGLPGETVDVNIVLNNNPGIASLKLDVAYGEYLTLTVVEFNSAFGSYVTAPEPFKNPQSLSMLSPMSDINVSGVFATLTFRIAENAPADYTSDIQLSYDEENLFNSDFENVDVALENGRVLIGGNDTSSFTIQAEQVSGMPGEIVDVNVLLNNNPGISSLKLNVDYGEYLTLTAVEFNSAFGSYVTAPEPYKNPQPLSMLSPMSDINVNGVFATLKFKINENAPIGHTSNIQLSYDEEDLFNSNFDNVEASIINGKITIENKFGISAKTGTSTVIDKNSKIIYGLDEMFIDINDYITCSNCEISVNATINGLGTGSTVNVIVDDSVKETYTILIFGDVNGDGKCDGEDSIIVDCFVTGLLNENNVDAATYSAADCNHDGKIDNLDVELLQEAGLFISEVSQIKPN